MNELGSISVSPSFLNSISSAYKSSQASLAKEVQPLNAGKLSSDDTSSDDITDVAIISDEAVSLLAAEKDSDTAKSTDSTQGEKSTSEEESQEESIKSEDNLTAEQKEEVSKLKATDAEVKSHEQAHLAAAAGISASGPSYDYQTGPDGKKYAVGGEVGISFVKTNDPDENIANAETMKAAALAPSEPSSQDLAVARNADKLIAEAEKQKTEQETEAAETKDSADSADGTQETDEAQDVKDTEESSGSEEISDKKIVQ